MYEIPTSVKLIDIVISNLNKAQFPVLSDVIQGKGSDNSTPT